MMSKSKPIVQTNNVSYFAALDIGSNSFHFVLARQVAEHVQILHSEKYKVKLASGLNKDNFLDNQAIMRGIATLSSLCSSTSQLAESNFRAVATFTLRQAKNADEFLKVAKQVFPFDIEVISGHEEARLIYQGVSAYSASAKQRLVIDIGGGSTECIIGQQKTIRTLASLEFGCVSYAKKFFNINYIEKQQFNAAITSAKAELSSISKRYKNYGWQEAVGTSGTIKAIYNIVNQTHHIKQAINLSQLYQLQAQLLSFNNVTEIQLNGLKNSRQEVICSGVAILIALMESLNIKTIDYCKYALREGVLFEQLQSIGHDNTRQRTIRSLITRFNIDLSQLTLIETIANHIYIEVSKAWQFNKIIYQELLLAAVKLHEVGYDVSSTAYHKHGEYILQHADLAGFNQEQQQALAWLVGNQRKNIATLSKTQWHTLKPKLLVKLLTILRLSIIIGQQRTITSECLPDIRLDKQTLNLVFNLQWLSDRPLIDNALVNEQGTLAKHDVDIKISYR